MVPNAKVWLPTLLVPKLVLLVTLATALVSIRVLLALSVATYWFALQFNVKRTIMCRAIPVLHALPALPALAVMRVARIRHARLLCAPQTSTFLAIPALPVLLEPRTQVVMMLLVATLVVTLLCAPQTSMLPAIRVLLVLLAPRMLKATMPLAVTPLVLTPTALQMSMSPVTLACPVLLVRPMILALTRLDLTPFAQ
jgi:hypothetical protein